MKFLVVFAVFLAIQYGEALKCYTCPPQNGGDQTCLTDGNNMGLETSCQQDQTACTLTVQEVNGVMGYNRACSKAPISNPNKEDRCEKTEDNGIESEKCYCFTDLCNGAIRFHQFPLVSTIVAIVLISKVF